VFSIFGTLSILFLKEFGVGLAAAILIDATIVRAVLLPATMKLLGDWNWYLPSWLEVAAEDRLRREAGAGDPGADSGQIDGAQLSLLRPWLRRDLQGRELSRAQFAPKRLKTILWRNASTVQPRRWPIRVLFRRAAATDAQFAATHPNRSRFQPRKTRRFQRVPPIGAPGFEPGTSSPPD
jgi:hypothetical protein